jgi:hypothetical protein
LALAAVVGVVALVVMQEVAHRDVLEAVELVQMEAVVLVYRVVVVVALPLVAVLVVLALTLVLLAAGLLVGPHHLHQQHRLIHLR